MAGHCCILVSISGILKTATVKNGSNEKPVAESAAAKTLR